MHLAMHLAVDAGAISRGAGDLPRRADDARRAGRAVQRIGDGSRNEPLAAALTELADAVADVLEVSALALAQLGQRAGDGAVLYGETERALGSAP